jgi:hypothetical protein
LRSTGLLARHNFRLARDSLGVVRAAASLYLGVQRRNMPCLSLA